MKSAVLWIILCLGMTQIMAAQMYDPFRKIVKHVDTTGLMPPPPMMNAAPVAVPTIVTAVMNDRAFINGAWYRVGERVNNHEITYIRNDFVGLKEGNRLTMIAVGSNRRVLGTKDVQ